MFVCGALYTCFGVCIRVNIHEKRVLSEGECDVGKISSFNECNSMHWYEVSGMTGLYIERKLAFV